MELDSPKASMTGSPEDREGNMLANLDDYITELRQFGQVYPDEKDCRVPDVVDQAASMMEGSVGDSIVGDFAISPLVIKRLIPSKKPQMLQMLQKAEEPEESKAEQSIVGGANSLCNCEVTLDEEEEEHKDEPEEVLAENREDETAVEKPHTSGGKSAEEDNLTESIESKNAMNEIEADIKELEELLKN